MLEILRKAKKDLFKLIQDEKGWKSLYINYHRPFVERLWRPYGENNEYRLYLHRIHPCQPEEALLHPHSWPSAMSVESGSYEMIIGYGKGLQPSILLGKIILPLGAEYEMTHLDFHHSVRPIGKRVACSIMVTGQPWDRKSPKPEQRLGELDQYKKITLLDLMWRRAKEYQKDSSK